MQESAAARWVDRNVGGMLCAFASLLHRLRERRPAGPIKKVLFLEFFEMGAAIASYPALRFVRDRLPDAEIHALCMQSAKGSWELLGATTSERIHTIAGRNGLAFVFSLIRQIFRLRHVEFDVIIDLELFMRISALTSFMLKARRRAGFFRYELEGLYRGAFLDTRCGYNQNLHIARNFLALTRAAVEQATNEPNYKGHVPVEDVVLPAYQSDPTRRRRLADRLHDLAPAYTGQPLLLICPDVGPTLAIRNYPEPHYATVGRALLARFPDHFLLMIGTSENTPVCARLCRDIQNPRCVDFSGKTQSLAELVELIAMSDLLIGNDNGPAHFASLTETRILALFSTASPYLWGPLGRAVVLYAHYHCSPCICAFNGKQSKCRDNRCLQAITPQTVIESAVRILTEPVPYRTINFTIPYIY